jgi:hypothetical protein
MPSGVADPFQLSQWGQQNSGLFNDTSVDTSDAAFAGYLQFFGNRSAENQGAAFAISGNRFPLDS